MFILDIHHKLWRIDIWLELGLAGLKKTEKKNARLTTNLPPGALKIAVSFKTTIPNHPSLGYFFQLNSTLK